jgi:hypothetical protein
MTIAVKLRPYLYELDDDTDDELDDDDDFDEDEDLDGDDEEDEGDEEDEDEPETWQVGGIAQSR